MICQHPSSSRLSRKYTFDFTLDEVAYRAWYDPDKDFICFDCGSGIEESIREFMLQLRQLINEHAGVLGIDEPDLEAFAFKHLNASIDVGKTSREGNGSN